MRTTTTTATTATATDPRVRAVRPDLVEVHQYAGTATILDVRERQELLQDGWIGGSVHVPASMLASLADPSSATHLAQLDPAVPIVVCSGDGGDSAARAAALLLELGFTDVGLLAGGLAAWRSAGRAVAGISPWRARPTSPTIVGADTALTTTRSTSMNSHPEDLPIELKAGELITRYVEWGGMALRHASVPAGTDMGPVLAGLPDDRCPSDHWGIVLEGSLELTHADGSTENATAGSVYYWPAGHTARTDEGAVFLEVGPLEGMRAFSEHAQAKLA